MNSDARRIASQSQFHVPFNKNPELYESYQPAAHPGISGLWDRLNGSTLVSVLLIILALVYQSWSRIPQLPPLPDVLWDAVVYLIPSALLDVVDRRLNPPLFPRPPPPPQSMLQSQRRSHGAKSEMLRRILCLDNVVGAGGAGAGAGAGAAGIMMSVSQAGRRGLSSLSGAVLGGKGTTDQPPGLGNYDNSCYQNSVLQALAALKPLPAYLASVGLGAKQMDNGRAASRTTDSLRDLIAELSDTANNGKTLWTPDVLKNMSTWQQQDAQEYYSKLLDEVDKEVASAMRAAHKPTGFQTAVAVATAADCASASGKDDSAASQHSDDSGYHSLSTSAHAGSGPGLGASEMKMLKNPLEGLTAQRVACAVCGFSEGLSMIPFNCLTLNLGMDAEYDLYERLDHCTKVEFIQGVECAKCTLLKFRDMLRTIIDRSRQAGRKDEEFPDFFIRLAATEAALEEADFSAETTTKICKVPSSCRVDSTKTKQGVIARPPRSLVIHMNRSVFDEKTGHMFKNLAAVRFPRTLDLGPWCLGGAEGRTGEIDEQDGAAGMLSLHSEQASSSTADTAEQWLLDPAASMIAGDLRPSKFTGPLYELRAVIVHYGRHENGHYICYRRHPRASKPRTHSVKGASQPAQLTTEHGEHHDERPHNDVVSTDGDGGNTTTQGVREEPEGGSEHQISAKSRQQAEAQETDSELTDGEDESAQWWRLSDQDVTLVDEETVLSQGGVFMLFYDCVDSSFALTTDCDRDPFAGSSEIQAKAARQDDSQRVRVALGEVMGLAGDGAKNPNGDAGATNPENANASSMDMGNIVDGKKSRDECVDTGAEIQEESEDSEKEASRTLTTRGAPNKNHIQPICPSPPEGSALITGELATGTDDTPDEQVVTETAAWKVALDIPLPPDDDEDQFGFDCISADSQEDGSPGVIPMHSIASGVVV